LPAKAPSRAPEASLASQLLQDRVVLHVQELTMNFSRLALTLTLLPAGQLLADTFTAIRP
jgi:vitamin B12 transporter